MIKIRIERSTTLDSGSAGLAAAFAGQKHSSDEHQLVAIRADEGDIREITGGAIAVFTASFPEVTETETEIVDESDDAYTVELGGQKFTAAQWEAVRHIVEHPNPGPVDDDADGDGEEDEGEDKPEPETTESFEREAEDAFETVWRLTFSDDSEALYLREWRGAEFIGVRHRFKVDDPEIVAKQLVGILADGRS